MFGCSSPGGFTDVSCDQMNYLNSYIFHASVGGYLEQINPLIDLVQRYGAEENGDLHAGYRNFNRAAYDIAYYSTTTYGTSPEIDASYDFCGFDCTVITQSNLDTGYSITDYNYQLVDGSCSDNFVTKTNWLVLVSVTVTVSD